jgi:FkbM family methyltransferase
MGSVNGAVRRVRRACHAFISELTGRAYARTSYSQYGEDLVVLAVMARFPASYRGFYVDVGAHHPHRFSNTCIFYQMGWRGICIDPLPSAAPFFARYRPRDLFIPQGVSETDGMLTYYIYGEGALNTFSEEAVRAQTSQPTRRQQIRTEPLRAILRRHLPADQRVDFLSIDAEGFDMQVLRSNDWHAYSPRVVLIEDMSGGTAAAAEAGPAAQFLKGYGYILGNRLPTGLIFLLATEVSPNEGFLKAP